MSIGPQRPSTGGSSSNQDPRLDTLMASMPKNELFIMNNSQEFQGIGFKIPDMELANSVTGVDSSGKWKAFTFSPLAQQLISFNSESMVKGLLGIEVPTSISELSNDAGYITAEDVPAMQAQVNADWNSSSGVSQVLNKPNLSPVALSGDYADLANKPVIPTVNYPITSVNNKLGAVNLTATDVGAIATGASIPYSTLTGVPNIPAAQVASDWNSVSGVSSILNKPTLFSGAYADLSGKPVLFSGNYTDLAGKPTLFDGTYASLTGKPTTFTPSSHTHAVSDVTGLQTALDSKLNTGATIPYSSISNAPVIPTNTNQLTNGSGYITSSALSGYALTSSLSGYATTASLTSATTGLRKVETFLGTSDASGNITITFSNTYTTPPDVQPQLVGGTFNQFVRIVSVSNTGCVINAGQRNLATVVGIEVLLAATVALAGASVTVQITPRN